MQTNSNNIAQNSNNQKTLILALLFLLKLGEELLGLWECVCAFHVPVRYETALHDSESS